MRIGLITTLNTNIGDDFIREGICLVLREVFKGRQMEFVPVNKHQPLTVYHGWYPLYLSKVIRFLPTGYRLIERFAPKPRLSRFDACDLIVQCGTPVFWPGCHSAEWAELLWHQVVGRLSKRISVLNLAAGSCYPWERQPLRIDDPQDAHFLQTILGYCRLTTVRDTLSQKLSLSLGMQTALIPCSAFLASGDHVGGGQDSGLVLINYMHGGGHYDWGQAIDASVWRDTVRILIGRLRSRHKLAFLCHNQAEYELAIDVDSTVTRLWPKTTEEYFALVSNAKIGLCNRMHASVALAGMGIPSIAVCTDTRLLMVDAIGLPCFYVKEAVADRLEDDIEDLLANRRQWKERLLTLKSQTWNAYVQAVYDALH